MIIHIALTLKQLFEEGKNFSWPRPQCRCGNPNPWGHGYVSAYLDGFADPLWLKRYRCPVCNRTILLKPKGYLKRFRTSIKTIRSSVKRKQATGKWLKGICRYRQNHWYRAVTRNARAYFGDLEVDLVAAFDALLIKGVIPMSRSI